MIGYLSVCPTTYPCCLLVLSSRCPVLQEGAPSLVLFLFGGSGGVGVAEMCSRANRGEMPTNLRRSKTKYLVLCSASLYVHNLVSELQPVMSSYVQVTGGEFAGTADRGW